MSNILKGIQLNEVSPHDYDSDWDYQDALARSGRPRSSHRSEEDDTFDSDVAYSRKIYQATKAAKEKAQRDSDHDRLATGTNESLDDPWGDQGNFAGDKPANLGNASIKNILVGDTVKYLGQPSKVVAMSKDRKYSRINISKGMGSVTQDVLTSDLQQLGQGVKEEQLDEISNEKLAQYKTAAAADASKADKEGDYKRGDKRFSGIVKATKKQFANDTKKSGISQGINEFSPGATGPKGPKDYGQPNSSRYIGGNKFVVGTTNNYVLTATIDKWGLEWDEDDEIWFLDSPGAAHIADASEGEIELPPPREQRYQIHDLVTDYLNTKNSADLQKVAAYYGHSDDGEMATNEEFRPTPGQANNIRKQTAQKMNPNSTKFVWKRPNQIGGSHTEQELLSMGFRKSTKHNVWGGTQDMWNRLSGNLDENLGDQLKSTSLNALVQAKLAIEKQREADIEAWRQDFEKNTVQKAQQGLNKVFQPTPVSQPGEKHSILKARLAQLNSAIQKQELLDKLVNRLERRGLMTHAMQNDADTRMHVRYGAKDNYESLNNKLDNAIATLQNRLNIRKISGLKEEGHEERDEYDNPRMGRDYGKGNLFVDPGSTEFKKEVHVGSNDGERGRPKNLKGVSKALPADAFGRTTGKIPDSAKPTSKDDPFKDIDEELDENLHKWFQEKWVRFGPDGKIRGDCARGDDSEGKPKCLPQSKAHSLGKKGRASAAARKRREDPNPERSGKAINVNTKKKTNENEFTPMNVKDYEEKAEQLHKLHLLAIRTRDDKKEEQIKRLRDELDNRAKQGLVPESVIEACWKGYHKEGNKKMFGKTYPNCVKNEDVAEGHHAETCPHCGGEMVSEELMNEKKDACYYKVKSRYKVWPSAYASGALVKCRKKGASNWGTGGKKLKEFADDDGSSGEDILRKYAKMWYNGDNSVQQQVEQILDRMGWEIGELESEEGGAFVVRSGDEHGDSYIGFTADDLTNNLEEKWSKKYKDSINCSNPKGFSQKAHCAGKKKNESAIMSGLNQLDEGWKEKLGAAALAGSMALGAGSAHSRVTPDGQGGFTGGLKPSPTVNAPTDNKPSTEAPSGFSKEYLQKAADPNRTGRYMISVEKAQELLKNMP